MLRSGPYIKIVFFSQIDKSLKTLHISVNKIYRFLKSTKIHTKKCKANVQDSNLLFITYVIRGEAWRFSNCSTAPTYSSTATFYKNFYVIAKKIRQKRIFISFLKLILPIYFLFLILFNTLEKNRNIWYLMAGRAPLSDGIISFMICVYSEKSIKN